LELLFWTSGSIIFILEDVDEERRGGENGDPFDVLPPVLHRFGPMGNKQPSQLEKKEIREISPEASA
jgi:hypothetical protein